MANSYFQFKQFRIEQDKTAMKVTTDGCLFGAWVAARVKAMDNAATAKALDIGAGTGLLSLMLAQQFEGVIDAVEIESNAAGQAGMNIADSPWKNRIRIIQEDIIEYAAKTEQQYELIIANPPFYQDELQSPDQRKNIAHHDAGLRVQTLLGVIKRLLNPSGVFFVLLPAKEKKNIELMLSEAGLSFSAQCLLRPSAKHEVFRLMLAGTHTGLVQEQELTEIVIKEENGDYTTAFKTLLQEYYLHL